jgi:cytochrome P450
MSNKDGCFVKTKIATRVTKLLFGGVAILDAEKWAKHRRILNPAFHAEKLKVFFPSLLKYLGAIFDLRCLV